VTSKKIGKILTECNFKKKIKLLKFQNQVYKKFFFLFQEKKMENKVNKSLKFSFLFNQLLFYFKMKKNLLLAMILTFSCFWVKISFNPFFYIKIDVKNCPKKNRNNLFQLFATAIDFIQGGFENIEKISIKFENSFTFKIISN
jgi:hypothetical protein